MQSIASFAENLVTEELTKIGRGESLSPASTSVGTEEGMKDIRNIEVPDSFMHQILGESTEEKTISMPSDQKHLQDLVEKFNKLVEEGRELLQEITSVGGLGVNLGGKTNTEDPFKKEQRRKDVKNLIAKKLRKKKQHG